MVRILVAMEREAEALGVPCEVIGIGGASLPEISPDDIVANVGYCGGYKVPVGTVVEPIASIDADTWWAEVLDQHFDCPKAVCFSSTEFMTEPLSGRPAVYDMELALLAGIRCKELYVLKIVSDNLNEQDCENFHDEIAWSQVRTLLRDAGLIASTSVPSEKGREARKDAPIRLGDEESGVALTDIPGEKQDMLIVNDNSQFK